MAQASRSRIRVGCAGWSIPRSATASFPGLGSHLERYASRLNAVEINTSFYRPHRPATYARWSSSVPDGFLFSVKMPKSITHELRLCHVVEPLKQFLTEVAALGPRLGCILAQFPPSLQFVPNTADAFFRQVRERYNGRLACEPRHASWFTSSVTHLFEDHAVARVAADPPRHSGADEPAGFSEFSYFRLHGSPQTYYSRYADETISALACKLDAISKHSETWCIFDNTAAGHAADNALQLLLRLAQAT